MPIPKRCSHLTHASPPDKYGIYEFGIMEDGGTAIIYTGRARQGQTTLARRFQEHKSGRGNPFVHQAITVRKQVLYRCLEADAWTDPATLESEHLDAYYDQHGELPPGNARRESVPAWHQRMRVVIRNMFE